MPINPLREKGFQNVLDAVGSQNRPAGAFTRDIPMHAKNMRSAAKKMQPILGDTLTSGGLQFAGFVNEAIDSVRGKLNPSKAVAGFDQSDLVANKVGIDQGIADAKSLTKAVQSQPEPSKNNEEENESQKDRTTARTATDPVSRKRALFNALNKPTDIEGAMGGINGVLASLGGK